MKQQPKRLDPLFIVGNFRSGTTFLANSLIQHPALGLAPETNFVKRLLNWDQFGPNGTGAAQLETLSDLHAALDFITAETKFADLELERSQLEAALRLHLPLTLPQLVRLILQAYCKQKFPGCSVWGIKKESYIFHVSALQRWFPQAKFIHILRDGRAVFNSSKRAIHSLRGQPFESSPVESAERWLRVVNCFDHFQQQHPDACLEITYEGLIRDPKPTLDCMFKFLAVEPAVLPDLYSRHEADWVPDRYQHLHQNVGKPPLLARINAWQQELSATEIGQFEQVAAATLQRKNYPLLGHA